jgi:3-isopropylmalate dehydratase small subunit
MSFPEVMRRVSAALDDAGISYMLTGSFASVFYGSPRSTQAIDIVIAATSANLRVFLLSLPGSE